MEVMTPPVGRNIKELIRQVQAFQHVRATGDVTPAGWYPGDPTLEAGSGAGRQGVDRVEADQRTSVKRA